jgi:hypothetical protein
MKVIFIHPDEGVREKLVQWLEERNHVAIESGARVASWPPALAEHEPDLVLAPYPLEEDPGLRETLMKFPDCQFRVLGENEADREATLRAAEDAYVGRRIESRGFADEHRFVIHDPAYQKYASLEKLHRPKEEPGWQETALKQEAYFVLQLQTGAAGGHQRAKQYHSVLRRFHRQLSQECAYRLGHSSYKIGWMRDEIARWMTVLCHYLPGADIAVCPQPQNVSREYVYLHHDMPETYSYPILCVLQCMPRPSVAKEIIRASTWRYSGESEEDLARVAYTLCGVNAYLSEIARAQIWCMDQFLSADSDFHRSVDVDRDLHRAIGSVMEFWGWDYLYGMGHGLRAITSRVLTGETRVEPRDGNGLEIVPSFRKFREALRESKNS